MTTPHLFVEKHFHESYTQSAGQSHKAQVVVLKSLERPDRAVDVPCFFIHHVESDGLKR